MKAPFKKHAIVCTLLALAFFCVMPMAVASVRQEIIAGPVSGEVLGVLDGDTVTVRLHVWIGQNIETHVRINGIDTPEMKGKCDSEREKAQAARDALAALLADAKISLYNIRLEKYAGRVLADAATSDGTVIAKHMIGKGFARPYRGEKRGGWCS